MARGNRLTDGDANEESPFSPPVPGEVLSLAQADDVIT